MLSSQTENLRRGNGGYILRKRRGSCTGEFKFTKGEMVA